MSWNYRLVKRTDPDGTVCVAIHEAYYDDADQLNGVTQDGVEVFGAGESEAEAVAECLSGYHMMAEAFGKPVLDYEAIGAASRSPGGLRSADPQESVDE